MPRPSPVVLRAASAILLWGVSMSPALSQDGAAHGDQAVLTGQTDMGAALHSAPYLVRVSRAKAEAVAALDTLFADLKQAANLTQARALAQRIWAIWLEPAKEASKALMRDGQAAMATRRLQDAEDIFSALIDQDPDYAEGWNKRATVRFYQGDFAGSVADIKETLAREPRHFGALSGLAMIRIRQGENRKAIAAAQRAQQVYPLIPSAPRIFEQAGSSKPEPI